MSTLIRDHVVLYSARADRSDIYLFECLDYCRFVFNYLSHQLSDDLGRITPNTIHLTDMIVSVGYMWRPLGQFSVVELWRPTPYPRIPINKR